MLAIGGVAWGLAGAVGGLAIARDVAIGGAAFAAHVNDEVARDAIARWLLPGAADRLVGLSRWLCVIPALVVLWRWTRVRRSSAEL
jgi:hypothetical protein